MKKILYLHAGAEMYGADKILYQLVTGIDKTVYKPIVVLPNDGVLVRALRKEGITVKVISYPVLRRNMFNPKGIFKFILDYFTSINKIYKYLGETTIDIIHVNTLAVFEGVLLKRKLKAKLLWHVHEIIVSPKIVFRVTSFVVGLFSDQIIAVSEAVKDNLLKSRFIKADKVQVIYNGVDTNTFGPNVPSAYLNEEFGVPEDAIIVGMIGRVNGWKGQHDFLKALNLALASDKKMFGVFVGGVFSGQEWRMEELSTQVKKSPFSSRMIISDYRTDVPNIHNWYDIFILPSTNPDPLPTVVLEAMASGKPIIGYGHGGICEMVTNENGILVDPGDFAALGQAILQVSGDLDKRKSMGKSSRKIAMQKFSINSFIGNFELRYTFLQKGEK